jgi:antitoxin MazE
MEKSVRVAKWGNSLAVRLPAAVVDALDPKRATRSKSMLPTSVNSACRASSGCEELLKRARAFRGRLSADFNFDMDEANAR